MKYKGTVVGIRDKQVLCEVASPAGDTGQITVGLDAFPTYVEVTVGMPIWVTFRDPIIDLRK